MKVLKRFFLVSVVLVMLIVLTGCGIVPCTTGTLNLNINDNWYYWVDIDGWEWATTDDYGDVVIPNIPTGWHTIYVLSTDYWCDYTTTIYINCGMNYLNITPNCW